MDSHDYITNKLACLVRDALGLEYIKVVAGIVAVTGTQLIAPYNAMTISSRALHTSFKQFWKL